MIKILKKFIDPKCKFWKTCEFRQDKAPICNSDKQANGYCGMYSVNQFQSKWK